ncbi:MAG: helix-turn-helix domain-containing protein [Oscillospiraceae bacterium]|nr:helix-turn-helix domain-containing protein [Oscillospiraceae bacterium]
MLKMPKTTSKSRKHTDFERLSLLLTVKDISEILRISRAGAYNLINSREFPKVKVGKRVLIEKTDLMRWLQQNKHV